MVLQSLSNWPVRMPAVQQLARGSIVAVGTSPVEGASDIVYGYGSTFDCLACSSPQVVDRHDQQLVSASGYDRYQSEEEVLVSTDNLREIPHPK